MEKPILFSTPMVKAILEGRKTMTRRIIKFKFLLGYNPEWTGYKPIFEYGEFFLANSKGEPATMPVKCPYEIGDILWVRETWLKADDGIRYRADETSVSKEMRESYGYKWRPSIHIPKEAARIFLKVTNVRVERLQDITQEDIEREGLWFYSQEYREQICIWRDCASALQNTRRKYFKQLWESTLKKKDLDRYGWDANPWVWVIEFEKI